MTFLLPRHLLLLSVSTLFVMGLLMIFNTSSAEVIDLNLMRSTHFALERQILYSCVGGSILLCIQRIGYRRFIAASPYLLLLLTGCLVLTLLPGIGRVVNGARRWIAIGSFSFQPSEFVKYLIPTYMIHAFSACDVSQLSIKSFIRLMILLGIPLVLILIEPNHGTAAVILILILMMCICTCVPLRYWAVPLLLFSLIGAFSAFHVPYVSARLKVYLHPELDLRGKGHQPYQAKIAAGSGGLLGVGPGNSLQKLSYLPEAQNDYIAAVYAEEFGFIGMLCLILLYMTMGYAGFCIAYRARERQAGELATAITFLICFQAFVNLGVVCGLLPSTGLNLPFFSQGGSSLMANAMGLGLLWQIGTEQENTRRTICQLHVS